jgi:hypothetical protein
MATDTPELDQYQKEKEEFSDAMDEVFDADNEDKTDEEIIAEMDKKDADKSDVGGEPKKDLVDPAPESAPAASDSDADNLDGQVKPVTDTVDDPPDTIEAWKNKAEELEAELAKERQKTSSWNGRITAANTKVKELEAKILELEAVGNIAKDSEDKATTESDNEVLERFRSDFPELSTAFDIMQKRIDGVTPAPAKAAEPDTSTASTSSADNAADTVKDAQAKVNAEHTTSIRKVHPDLPEMVNTGVLLSWINKQPSYIRPTLETIYKSGTAEDVITMVTNFKDSSGWKSQLKPADGKNKTAADKLNSMREVTSESHTPSGTEIDKNDYDQGAKDAGL